MQEQAGFSDNEAQQLALNPNAGDESLSIRFRIEERLSPIKSEGGIMRFDRWKDTANIDRVKSEMDALGIDYKESLNDKDDTIDIKVKGKGHPVYDAVEYIEIRSGDKTDIKDRPVTKSDKLRFSRRYNAWKAGRGSAALGMPLTMWPGVTKSMVEELANLGLGTVEQLATVSDETISRIGPIQSLKQKAKAYLEQAKGLAPVAQVLAENAELKQQMAAMEERMSQFLLAQAKPTEPAPVAPVAPVKRGPGRPPKAHTESEA